MSIRKLKRKGKKKNENRPQLLKMKQREKGKRERYGNFYYQSHINQYLIIK